MLFNAIKRLQGVTQKALTQCLRRLGRNGLVERRVAATGLLAGAYAWTLDHLTEVEAARDRFDGHAGPA